MGDTHVTAQELFDALLNTEFARTENDQWYYGGEKIAWDDLSWECETEDLSTDVGPVRLVARHGGEGQGNRAHLVFQVKRTGQYFRVDGSYSSYEGTDWDELSLRPVQRKTKEVVYYG
jgi:hypothetical protein